MGNKVNPALVDPKEEALLKVFKGKGLDFFKDIGNFFLCPTGEPYWTVLSGGVKPEGMKAEFFKSEKEAIEAWNENIGRIIELCAQSERVNRPEKDFKVKLTIFWRKFPEIRVFLKPGQDLTRWTVYSRFRISGMPIIQGADYNQVEGGKDAKSSI